jgi:hypothetical protein
MEEFMIGVVSFVKMYPGRVKAGLLLLGALVALACGAWLPTPHSRAVAEALGLAVAAIAGRVYLP